MNLNEITRNDFCIAIDLKKFIGIWIVEVKCKHQDMLFYKNLEVDF